MSTTQSDGERHLIEPLVSKSVKRQSTWKEESNMNMNERKTQLSKKSKHGVILIVLNQSHHPILSDRK